MLGQKDAALFKAVAKATDWCVRNFTPHNIANTAWAFAKVSVIYKTGAMSNRVLPPKSKKTKT